MRTRAEAIARRVVVNLSLVSTIFTLPVGSTWDSLFIREIVGMLTLKRES